jgi:hypothetical protein
LERARLPKGTKVAAVEKKLRKEYGSNDHAVYGILNKAGLMRGSKTTKKGMKKSRVLTKAEVPHGRVKTVLA